LKLIPVAEKKDDNHLNGKVIKIAEIIDKFLYGNVTKAPTVINIPDSKNDKKSKNI
jgi:hypothetical protein